MPSRIRNWIGFVAMCLGMFMAILDIQVVASSLTSIETALHIPGTQLSWIQTGYLIAEVIAIPLTGWLTRALSLRWLYAGATLGFVLASLGCAASWNADTLIAIRVIQGFCGGMLIPAVFTSAFVILPEDDRVLATTVAGALAMIAPTIGPTVGGYITQLYSWHWIFLINVVPGFIVVALVIACVRLDEPNWKEWRIIDYSTIILAALFLGSLELLLKKGPQNDWRGALVYSLLAICPLSGIFGVYLSLRRAHPLVDLRKFQERGFTLACILSFALGMGLYGSVYVNSLFLGIVRGHGPLQIGEIMIAYGAAQLVSAPFAAYAEARYNPRWLTALGFAVFALGMFTNAELTSGTDFAGLFWQQILRGGAILLCLLPATRIALDMWEPKEIPDASALFNLMRNVGGAIGIAVIDTILEQRTAGHAHALVDRLQAGDPGAARIVGLPVQYFHNVPFGQIDETTRAIVTPLISRAALTQSFNEAWVVLGVVCVAALVTVPFLPGKLGPPGGHRLGGHH
jgi:DHA2 family multidrug resistance protein